MATIAPFSGLHPRPEHLVPANFTPNTLDFPGCERGVPAKVPGLREDVLVQDPAPCYYAYRVDYRTEGGLEKSRSGLVARIDPFGVERRDVISSIDAAAETVEETVELLRSTGLKTGFIIAGYEDAQFEVERILVRGMGNSPLTISLPDERHTIWPVRNQQAIRELTSTFEGKECVILEGVHHFRAARRLRDVAHEEGWVAPEESFYPLVHLVNVYDFGVTLGSFQYLVPAIEGFNLNAYVLAVSSCFEVQTYRWSDGRNMGQALAEFEEDFRIQAANTIAVGAYFPGEDQFFLFVVRDGVDRVTLFPPDVSSLYHNFAVTYARLFFIDRHYFRSDQGDPRWRDVVAVPTVAEAVERAQGTGIGAAFFLQPPTKRNLANLARRGKRLPAASIRLQPPPLCGVVMDRLAPCFARTT